MNKIKILLLVLLGTAALSCSIIPHGKTTVFIVRHAEKDVSDPKNQDPELSIVGKKRSQDLALKLKNEKLDAVFSTKFKRTNQTAALLAKNNNIDIQIYDAHDFSGIAKLIKTKYKGRMVLIVGHSNTVLEMVEAFEAKRPLAALNDDDYDLFFEVNIDHKGNAEVSTSRYGEVHHSSLFK